MHTPLPEQGRWLQTVLKGHYPYYGVPRNGPARMTFRKEVTRLWKQSLERRSQTGRVPWERMGRLARQWLPDPRICQPYPIQRLCVIP